MELEAGRVLSDRYRLVRPLGQGSQGAVWIADHLALNTHVAVKLIDPELAKREDARERFKREATAAAQLRSAHVVQIMDHGIDEGQPFIVMELLEGEDLFERLDKRGRLSLRETSKIITQVCRALARAHAAGIVHRDLKPENVFLCNNDDEEIVKVLDFGVAKVTDPAKATMQKTGIGTLIGTPHYMSPEQVKGVSEVDARTDLWAIGVIAYQCVVGDLPFDSEGVGDLLIKISIGDPPVPSKVFPGASPVFDTWFAKACDRDRTKRFQSARELAEALARVVQSVPEAMRGAPPPRPMSVRPPPVAADPTSVRGTKPGISPAPQVQAAQAPASVRRPPALPTKAAAPAPAPPVAAQIIEAPRAPLPTEQEIDDFDFDFDEEPSAEATEPEAAAPAPVAVPPARPSVSSSGPAVPPARVSVPATQTPMPAPAPAAVAAEAPAEPAPRISTSLGAPVFDAAMLAGTSSPSKPPQPAYVAPTTAPGLSRGDGDRISPPPELDGSRKSRTLGIVFFLFVLAAGGIAFFVVQSNMLPPEPAGIPSAMEVPMPEPPPVVVVPNPSSSFTPLPTTTVKTPPTKYTGKPLGPGKTKTNKSSSSGESPTKSSDKPGDIVIEVPTPAGGDDDSVPPAP